MGADRRFERAALDLAERGYFVFPCRPRGKEPLTERGYKDASRDERRILHWWDRHPTANVGVACGASGIVVLDVDTKHGADPKGVMGQLEIEHHPVVVWTGEAPPRSEDLPNSREGERGAQLYFRGDLRVQRDTAISGVEIRGAGAYVIAPPSVHPSGVPYGGRIAPVAKLAEVPPQVRAITETRAEGEPLKVGERIPQGTRHESLLSIGGSARRRGAGEEALSALMHAENEERGDPPLPRGEVGKLVRYLLSKDPEDPILGRSSELLDGAKPADPPPAGAIESTVIDFAEIKSRRIRWLVPDRVPLGKMTGISGRPKIGKGLWYSDLAAQVTRGEAGGDISEPRHVMIVTTEDAPGDTLKPRLLAAGADPRCVSYFQMGSKDEPVPFRVPEHATALRDRILERESVLVVVDPLVEFIDGRLDTHKSQHVRAALASLNAIVREFDCAILVVIHLNKGMSTDTHIRHEASGAFTQVIRGSLLLGHDPEDPEGEGDDQRVLAVSSSNLARIPPALVYRIEEEWPMGDEGEPIPTARMVLIGESTADSHDLLAAHDPDARGDRDDAKDFLLAELRDGARKQREVETAGGRAHSHSTLKRARRELGVRSQKEPVKDGPWWLALPDQRWPWEFQDAPESKGTKSKGANPPSQVGPLLKDGSSKRDPAPPEVEGDHGSGAGPLRSESPHRGCPSHPEPVASCRYCARAS
jgi:RecA-family ATPase